MRNVTDFILKASSKGLFFCTKSVPAIVVATILSFTALSK